MAEKGLPQQQPASNDAVADTATDDSVCPPGEVCVANQCQPLGTNGNGYSVALGAPNDANIHPGAAEACGDGIVNNCDGAVNENCDAANCQYHTDCTATDACVDE